MCDFVFSPRVIRGCRLCRRLLPLYRRQGSLVSSLWHSARRYASDRLTKTNVRILCLHYVNPGNNSSWTAEGICALMTELDERFDFERSL